MKPLILSPAPIYSSRWFIGQTVSTLAMVLPLIYVMAPDTQLWHFLGCVAFSVIFGTIADMILYPEIRIERGDTE